MKIILYCQYVWGMGHLFRTLELVRALAGHDVILIAGGQDVDIRLPAHARLERLPVLYMDEEFTRLIPGDPQSSLKQVQRRRRECLTGLFESNSPDVFVVELYPFGRTAFAFELDPLLEAAREGRFGRVRTVCSLRDILVYKKYQQTYEDRVVDKLKRYFDLLLVHADPNILRLEETFGSLRRIGIPVHYTGFVSQQGDPFRGEALRRELGLAPQERLVVASAGGGRSGYFLLKRVLAAAGLLAARRPVRLEVFAGPFMPEAEYRDLQNEAGAGIRVRRFTDRFLDYLFAADLSVSRAGYNTCMNLLASGVPSMVWPYRRQQEQPLRLEKISGLIPMQILDREDLDPAALSNGMQRLLETAERVVATGIDLGGAARTAALLTRPAHGGPPAP
jgi:predicted glycosyltransferase